MSVSYVRPMEIRYQLTVNLKKISMREFFIHYSLFSHFFDNPNPHYFENLSFTLVGQNV